MFRREWYCKQDETCPVERILIKMFTKWYCDQNETLTT